MNLQELIENQIEGFRIDKEYSDLGISQEDQIKLEYLQKLLEENKNIKENSAKMGDGKEND